MARYAEDFGNDVVTAPDKHSASYFQSFFFVIGKIVKGRALYGNSRQFHGVEHRQRIEFSRAGNLPYHVAQNGRSFVGLEFIRDSPLRKLLGFAENIAKRYFVYFKNYSVDEKIERRSFLFQFLHAFFRVGVCLYDSEIISRFESLFFKEFLHLCLRIETRSVNVIAHYVETPFCGNFRIEISYCSRRAVSCVFKRFVVRSVVFFKHRQPHYAFALNFDVILIFNG